MMRFRNHRHQKSTQSADSGYGGGDDAAAGGVHGGDDQAVLGIENMYDGLREHDAESIDGGKGGNKAKKILKRLSCGGVH